MSVCLNIRPLLLIAVFKPLFARLHTNCIITAKLESRAANQLYEMASQFRYHLRNQFNWLYYRPIDTYLYSYVCFCVAILH
jgi:hypothetical protein